MADGLNRGTVGNVYNDNYRHDAYGMYSNGWTSAGNVTSGDLSSQGQSVNFPNARYQFVDWLDVAESAGPDAMASDLGDDDTLSALCDGIRGYDMGALVVDGHEDDEGVNCLNFMLEHGDVWDVLRERFGDRESVQALVEAVQGTGGGFEVATSYLKSHPTALDELMSDGVRGRRFRSVGLGSVAYDELLQERADIEEQIVGDDRGLSPREYQRVLKSVDPNVAPRVALSETEVPTWLFLAVDQSGDPSLRHSYGVTNMQGQSEGRLGIPCGLFVARMRRDAESGTMVPDIERVKTKSQIYVVPTGTDEGGADVYVVDPHLVLSDREVSGNGHTGVMGSDKKTSRIFSALCAHKDVYGDMLHAVDDNDEIVVVNPDDPSEVYRSVPAARFCLGEDSLRAMPVVDPSDLTGAAEDSRLRDYDPFNVRLRDIAKMSQGDFVDGAFDYRSDGSPESYLYEWMLAGDEDVSDEGYEERGESDDAAVADERDAVVGDARDMSPDGRGADVSVSSAMGAAPFRMDGQQWPQQYLDGQERFDPSQQGPFSPQAQWPQQMPPDAQGQQVTVQSTPEGAAQRQVMAGPAPMASDGNLPVDAAFMYGDPYDGYDEYDDYDEYGDYDDYDEYDEDAMEADDVVSGGTQPMPRVVSEADAGVGTSAPDIVSGARPDDGDGYHYVSAIGPNSYAPEMQDFEDLLRAARSGKDVKAAMMLNIGHLSSKIETFATRDLSDMRAVRESRIEDPHDRRPVALTHAGSSFAHAFGEAFMAEQPGFIRRLAGRLSRAMQNAARPASAGESEEQAHASVRSEQRHGVDIDHDVAPGEEPVGAEADVAVGETASRDGDSGAVAGTQFVDEAPAGEAWQEPDPPVFDFYDRYDPSYFYRDEDLFSEDVEEAYSEYEAMQRRVSDVSAPGESSSLGEMPVDDGSVMEMPETAFTFDDDPDDDVYADFVGYADGVGDMGDRVPPVFDGSDVSDEAEPQREL